MFLLCIVSSFLCSSLASHHINSIFNLVLFSFHRFFRCSIGGFFLIITMQNFSIVMQSFSIPTHSFRHKRCNLSSQCTTPNETLPTLTLSNQIFFHLPFTKISPKCLFCIFKCSMPIKGNRNSRCRLCIMVCPSFWVLGKLFYDYLHPLLGAEELHGWSW